MKRDSISPKIHSNASVERWNSSITRLEQRVDRTKMFISKVALMLAARLSRSSPFTIKNFLLKSLTPTKTKHLLNQLQISTHGIISVQTVSNSDETKKAENRAKCRSHKWPSMTLSGWRSVGFRVFIRKIFWAFQIRRWRLHGKTTWNSNNIRILSMPQGICNDVLAEGTRPVANYFQPWIYLQLIFERQEHCK